MKFPHAVALFAPIFMLASCNDGPKGMTRKIDGSSDAAAKESIALLTTELSPTELKTFSEAYGKIALRWAFGNAFNGEKTQGISEFLVKINGKTPTEIIQMAANLEKETPDGSGLKSEEKTEPPAMVVRSGIPFTIDGIDVLVTGVRIGKLKKIKREYSFGSMPEGDLLLVDVVLKNTTEGTIIQVQNVWKNSSVADNFGNIYGQPGGMSYGSAPIENVVSSQALKPGEAVKDTMVFKLPLENAVSFKLTADPNFYKPAENDRLYQISQTAFILDFDRSDIKHDAGAPLNRR